ncbi:MAG: Two component transcriptional regulator, winged helix family [uncultured bacterium]|nr:MAG: Two component transcriptional regulator, winged helix family [uncultured bacterium]
MRILVVEDEHKIAEALHKGLTQEKYAVDVAYTGTNGYDLAASEEYDLIILDLMLPGMDGGEICTQLRKDNVHVPILMLTAKNLVQDRIKGLDCGADDYLPKPFAFEELLARMRALLRRPSRMSGVKLKVGEWCLDTVKCEVKRNKQIITLSKKEYALIEYFLRHPRQILTKEQIMAHVWNYDADILPNTVEVYVKKLRAKKFPILTIRGFGYRLGEQNV